MSTKKLIPFNFWKIWLDFLPYLNFFSVSPDCYNKIPQAEWLKQQKCVLKVLEVGKSEIRVLVDLVSSENSPRFVAGHLISVSSHWGWGRPLQVSIFFFFNFINTSLFFFPFATLQVTWDLNFLTRDPACALCIGRQSLNHWPAREVPSKSLLTRALVPRDLTS